MATPIGRMNKPKPPSSRFVFAIFALAVAPTSSLAMSLAR